MKEFDSGTGAAVAEAPNEDAQFVNMDIALIVPSLSNRHDFDPVKLQGLADNIKARGVRFPIVVRPLPGSRLQETFAGAPHDPKQSFGRNLDRKKIRPTHEIVSGERRYHASIMAGKTTIPAIVRNTDDLTSLEDQLIENLQREDLSDLQEAEGYERLMALSNLTVDQVAEKLSLGRSYVYSHLKLLDLTSASKTAMKTGEIDYSRALLIARIPNAKLQEKAVKAATEKHQYNGTTMSLRDFQTWLRQNVMLRLDTAPFKITDIELMPEAGSCKECPKRTGANPDLFAEVDGADICTDPVCYADKAKQHRTILFEKAEAKGMRVIEGKEAKAIIKSQYNDSMEGYSRLDQKRGDISDDAPTLKKLLAPFEVQKVLIEHPHTKELIEAVPTAEAEALLVSQGMMAKTATKEKRKLEDEIESVRHGTDHKIIERTRADVFAALMKKVHAVKDDKVLTLLSAPLLRIWVNAELDSRGPEDSDAAMIFGFEYAEGMDVGTEVSAIIDRAPAAALIKYLVGLQLEEDKGYNRYYSRQNATHKFDAVAKTLRIDIADIGTRAKAAVKADINDKIKALRIEAAAMHKATTAAPPAARQREGAGEKKSPPAGAGARSGKKAGKLSPEDAQLGIADALQGIEGKAASTALQPVSEPPAAAAAFDKCFPTLKAGKTNKLQDSQLDQDPLLSQAAELIKREGKATVRLLKTSFELGTARAMTLMDALETAGNVSATNERGARTVLA